MKAINPPRGHIVVLGIGLKSIKSPESAPVALPLHLAIIAAKAIQAEIDAGRAAPFVSAGLVDENGKYDTVARLEGLRVVGKGGDA